MSTGNQLSTSHSGCQFLSIPVELKQQKMPKSLTLSFQDRCANYHTANRNKNQQNTNKGTHQQTNTLLLFMQKESLSGTLCKFL